MPKFDATYRLPALIFFAVLVASSSGATPTQENPASAASAQAPATAASAPSPAQSDSAAPPLASGTAQGTGTVPSVNSPLTYVITAPPPTPEQVGDSLSVRQRYQAAIAAYSKADPMTAPIWNKMGIAYQMMFDVKDAIRCYTASLKLDPRNAQVMNNLATVYDSQKQYGMGEKMYRKALKLDPKSALIHRNLGSNLMSQHKYKKGQEAYRAALAIDPQIFNSHSGASVQNPTPAQDRGALHYYMARGCVSAGNSECAIQNLRLSLNEGYATVRKIAADESFASLRELPGFQQLLASQTSQQ